MRTCSSTDELRVSDAVVVGNVVVDEVRENGRSARFLGGTGFNTAIALARSGLSTTLASVFAPDAAGVSFRLALEEAGIAALPLGEMPYSRVAVSRLVNGAPEYAFSTNSHLGMAVTERLVEAIQVARVSIVNSFPFESQRQMSDLEEAFHNAQGIRVVDPNPRPSVMRDRSVFNRNFDKLLGTVDIVKLSADDVRLLYDHSLEAMVAYALERGVGIVVLTRGASGAEVFTASGERYAAPSRLPPLQIVDSIGAGDTFLAALLASAHSELLEGTGHRRRIEEIPVSWQVHLERAVQSAEACCMHPGGPAQITLPE